MVEWNKELNGCARRGRLVWAHPNKELKPLIEWLNGRMVLAWIEGCPLRGLTPALDCQSLKAMSLEKRVEEGGFYYIHSINYDAAKNSLTVELMKAPEEISLARRFLIFEDIEDYSEEVDEDTAIEEAADGVIDSLIGLSEYLYEGKLRYELVTEDRVFNFHTKIKPRIEDV